MFRAIENLYNDLPMVEYPREIYNYPLGLKQTCMFVIYTITMFVKLCYLSQYYMCPKYSRYLQNKRIGNLDQTIFYMNTRLGGRGSDMFYNLLLKERKEKTLTAEQSELLNVLKEYEMTAVKKF